MFNFYLYNKSYQKANADQIQENLRLLNNLVIVERKEEDFFLMNDSIWECPTVDGSFSDVVWSKLSDKQFAQTVVPKLFPAIDSIPQEFANLEEFDRVYQIYNAFFGVDFDGIVSKRHITNEESYSVFREEGLRDVTPESLWERRELLFSRVILCPGVQKNLEKIGPSKYFQQIVNKLIKLDKYAKKEWAAGDFDCRKAKLTASIIIHDESEGTMRKYGNDRLFKMPDGTSQYCRLHLIMGDGLRIHFYPENNKIYIGYIGEHLPTVTG